MDAAPLDLSPSRPRIDVERLRDVVLVRIATASGPVGRATVARDLAPFAAELLGRSVFDAHIERDLAALADAGLVEMKATSVAITDAGLSRSAMLLGGRGPHPKSWEEARDVRLIARALGLDGEPLKKLQSLTRVEGLRAAIVIASFKLKAKGPPSSVRLRQSLAKLALARVVAADANAAPTQPKSGLSATAERTLAARLARKRKPWRTDAQLIAGLAADAVQARNADLPALQAAVLRRFLIKSEEVVVPVSIPVVKAKRTVTPITPVTPHTPALPAIPPPPTLDQPPSLTDFADDVREVAGTVAEGFAGNRKAFISRVWKRLAEARPHWRISDTEFKGMLVEAHRTGLLVLANADLKDDRNLRDVQDSAVSYRNAVFHFVRIDT
jgi:hypothetical protein